MNRAKSIFIQLFASVPLILIALPALAGGGGGGSSAGSGGAAAPEPGLLVMCAIVAGTEIGRRVYNKAKQ